MNKTLLIHNDNVAVIDSFTHEIKFEPTFSDIDKYISLEIVKELKNKEFDIVYIKDNLSSNYLELYGLRVAYHIRLSKKLKDKKYVPIVILSDIDIYALNKLTPAAKILFTKNVFLEVNHFDTVKHFNESLIDSMTQDDYVHKFLNIVDIEPPKDHHDITNEWAIHQWSNTLGATSDAIEINHNKISSMLYFKYLKALHAVKDDGDKQYEVEYSRVKGKILYIDDEWDKGWSDILNTLFSKSQDIEFTPFKYDYKDTNKFSMLKDIKQDVEKVNPDVVILDLRLSQTDHNKVSDVEQYTGIKVLKAIKEINPGIQVIMMTATRQSVILEKLYDYGVLGYIKKEHPDDVSVHTVENMDKLFKLAEDGLDRKYLKRIWSIQNKLIKLNMILNTEKERDNLNTHIKGKSINLYELQENKLSEESEKLLELKSTILMMYEILDSNIKKKFSYSVLTIFKCLEIVSDYYIKEESKTENKKRTFYAIWKHNNKIISQNGNCSVNNKLSNVINKVFIETDKDLNQNKNKIVCTRNAIIHPDTIMPSCENKVIAEDDLNEEDILNWFEMLNSILDKMDIFESSRSLDTEA